MGRRFGQDHSHTVTSRAPAAVHLSKQLRGHSLMQCNEGHLHRYQGGTAIRDACGHSALWTIDEHPSQVLPSSGSSSGRQAPAPERQGWASTAEVASGPDRGPLLNPTPFSCHIPKQHHSCIIVFHTARGKSHKPNPPTSGLRHSAKALYDASRPGPWNPTSSETTGTSHSNFSGNNYLFQASTFK